MYLQMKNVCFFQFNLKFDLDIEKITLPAD